MIGINVLALVCLKNTVAEYAYQHNDIMLKAILRDDLNDDEQT